jgi:hypothetical protein
MTRDRMSYANRDSFADPTLRSLVIERLKSQSVCSAAALLPTLAWSVVARSNAARPSRLRLFGNEAGNIGSDLIAMTLLQQRNRVNCSAKKAVT